MPLLQFWPKRFDDPDRVLKDLSSTPSSTWRERGEKSALALFHAMAERVPAYKRFLGEHHINHRRIKTVTDFAQVPAINKQNYLRKFPLHELSWDGNLASASMINRSSGSNGKPFYWPSNQAQRDDVGDFYDIVFSAMFDMRNKRTLVIIAYGMGSWVAGTTTLLSSIDFMNKYNCTFITPGYNKREVLEICRDIGQEYEQVVICAYPPLIKEIVDLSNDEGFDISKLRPKFIFGAEAFSEDFRDYILERVGSQQPLLDTMNTIGSADAMVLGHETPLSIALRRKIRTDPLLHDAVLGQGRMPTLAQYYPWQKFLQTTEQGELLITSSGSIPLTRYNIQDTAKVLTYEELEDQFAQSGHLQLKSALPATMRNSFDWKLPFVLLYGKSTNALKFYGAIVYPENIKAALERVDAAHFFTGKFKMQQHTDAKQDQRLKLLIELAPGIKPEQVSVKETQAMVVATLLELNSEYKCVYTDIGKKTIPAIKLVPYGYFELQSTQNKHRYSA